MASITSGPAVYPITFSTAREDQAKVVGSVEWAKAQLAEREGFYGAPADLGEAIQWVTDCLVEALCDISYPEAEDQAVALVGKFFEQEEVQG